jgi:hypothetical protein
MSDLTTVKLSENGLKGRRRDFFDVKKISENICFLLRRSLEYSRQQEKL